MKKYLVIAVLILLSMAAGTVGAELYLKRGEQQDREWVIAPIHRPDPELGYAGIPNAEGIDSTKINGKYQYRVNLKLDRNGLREVTGSGNARGSRCLVLLGDSVVFGIGVEAKDTFASRLQARLKDTRVFNFGYSGYGPHQTLRFLEIGREKGLLEGCREVKSYYFGIEDNYWRALGRAPWGLSAPKYSVVNGKLGYQGPFLPESLNYWNNITQKYRLQNRLMSWALGYGKEGSARDTELYHRIFLRMKEILAERYQSDFHVIYFTQGRDPKDPAFRKLEGDGLPIRYFEGWTEAIGIPLELVKPTLYLHDGTHPNELGHKFVADSLVESDLRSWLR